MLKHFQDSANFGDLTIFHQRTVWVRKQKLGKKVKFIKIYLHCFSNFIKATTTQNSNFSDLCIFQPKISETRKYKI